MMQVRLKNPKTSNVFKVNGKRPKQFLVFPSHEEESTDLVNHYDTFTVHQGRYWRSDCESHF